MSDKPQPSATQLLGLPQTRGELKDLLAVAFADGAQKVLTRVLLNKRPSIEDLRKESDEDVEKLLTMTVDVKGKMARGEDISGDLAGILDSFHKDISELTKLRREDDNNIGGSR